MSVAIASGRKVVPIPFSRDPNGMMLGEEAAILTIEELDQRVGAASDADFGPRDAF
jgi:3-oxoacyl-(acyl-carrier-protein) synthase